MKVMFNDTKVGLVRALLCLIVVIAMVCVGIIVFYAIVFHHEPFVEPSIDLTDLEEVHDGPLLDGSSTYSINGSEYEVYCKLKLRKDLTFGDPIAYVEHISPAYYEYFSPITSFPDGEWLASFKESGSGGVINRKNRLYILKRTDVDEMPTWVAVEHKKYID